MDRKPDDAPEAEHLTVEAYTDDDRVEAPPWYDDTINVGDEANRDAEQ
jgi:hypothetical protein